MYLLPSNSCDWLSFLLVSTIFDGRQMYIVDRMTQFKPTEQKTMSGEAAPGQSGDRANCAYADPLCGFEWESVSNKCVKQKITPQEDEGIEEKKKGIDVHPTRGPIQLFSRGCAYGQHHCRGFTLFTGAELN